MDGDSGCELIKLINNYVKFRERLARAHLLWYITKKKEDEDLWTDLIMENDDRWQELVQFIYKDTD